MIIYENHVIRVKTGGMFEWVVQLAYRHKAKVELT